MQVQIINDIIVGYGDFISGNDVFDAPDDYTPSRYSYTAITPNTYNPNGFAIIAQIIEVDFLKRQENINLMSNYMLNFVTLGQLTQTNFDLFLADVSALIQGYLNGGGRLITWVETVLRNGYNATTVGFKTRSAYRGTISGSLYPRAEAILAILNSI